MELDPTRACELLVGLGQVDVLGVDQPESGRLVVVVEPRLGRPSCSRCDKPGWVKDYREVDLVDLPSFGQPVTLRVLRTRWSCPRSKCGVGSWTAEQWEIAPSSHRLTTRAARWATEQVGRCGRSVNGIAVELGTDWHTINTAVMAYGSALLEADVDRVGIVHAVSLDEHSWCAADTGNVRSGRPRLLTPATVNCWTLWRAVIRQAPPSGSMSSPSSGRHGLVGR